MNRYLIFQLQGPMASWGEIAVGEVRHTRALAGGARRCSGCLPQHSASGVTTRRR